jgi:C4-dicarboxylate transporter DctM subunit
MTQNTIVAISAFVGLFALMAVRIPIGIGMAVMGVAGYWYLSGRIPALSLLAQSPIRNVTDWDLGIIPMFILMGAFATAAGMSRELFRASNAWLGHSTGRPRDVDHHGLCAASRPSTVRPSRRLQP